MRIPEPLQPYVKRFDAMSLRERVLVFLAAAAVLVYIGNNALLEPILKRQKVNSQRYQQQQDEIRTMQGQLQAYAQARLSEGANAKRRLLERRQAELASLDRELAGRHGQLVTADRMTRMLADILKHNPDIELLALRSLPATGLTQVPGPVLGGPGLYRHGVEITLSGTYFKMLSYLAELERKPEKLFWGNLDLQAGAYPNVTLKVTLYTLSTEKTWLLI